MIFLFIYVFWVACNHFLSYLQHLCQLLEVPLAVNKTFHAVQVMQLMGITLDAISMEARHSWNKVEGCHALCCQIKSYKKITLKAFQSLIGTLQSATLVIHSGPAFLCDVQLT